MQNTRLIDFIHLQFIVVILSFTAVLGKLITLPANILVWWRLLFAIIGLLVYFAFTRTRIQVQRKKLIQYIGIGFIVGLHWLTFFGAIKLSNISVTLVVMSSSTLFTSFFEPLLLKEKYKPLQIVFGLLIILGIALIFSIEVRYAWGIACALASSALASLFTALNKKHTQGKNSAIASFYELIGGFFVVSLSLFFVSNSTNLLVLPTSINLIWLAILGFLCTSYAYTASVKVMRSLSAYIVSLSINMEPIYGIILAFLFFADTEQMSTGFYSGAAIVFASIIAYPLINHRIKLSYGNK